MNSINFPKCEVHPMLEALRRLDDCPKQNYAIQDISLQNKVDKSKLFGFVPQVTQLTFILSCKECGSLYKLIVEYAVTRDSEDYEVISCQPY